jgi:hypothetical protein
MCLGATAVASVGALNYAGADPYGGGADRRHLARNALTARVPVDVRGPLDGPVGALASALHVAYYLRRKPTGQTVRAHAEQRPDLLALAESLLAAGAPEAAVAGVTLEGLLGQASL